MFQNELKVEKEALRLKTLECEDTTQQYLKLVTSLPEMDKAFQDQIQISELTEKNQKEGEELLDSEQFTKKLVQVRAVKDRQIEILKKIGENRSIQIEELKKQIQALRP